MKYTHHQPTRKAQGHVSSHDPNSASSQFYICLKDAKFLDGQLTEGQDVVSKIRKGDRILKATIQ